MNKIEARKKAREGSLTVGELRAMINKARGKGGMSTVNSEFEMTQVLDWYSAAVEGRPDNEKVATGYVYGSNQLDVVTATNILRDCA